MAYASDSALITSVRRSASKLSLAAKWANGPSLNVTDDFLYELYLLFQVLNALRAAYEIEYLPGSGYKEHQFPKKPAPKAGRPRFNLKEKGTGRLLYQICAGTTAADMNGHKRGLDLSIQLDTASDDPVAGDVLQIFDAKYRTKNTARITHHEFSEFVHWVELFQLRGRAVPGLDFGYLSDLNGNCLVTNGIESTELDVERLRTNLREVIQFHPTTTHAKKP